MSGAIPLRKALADLASRPVEEQAEALRSLSEGARLAAAPGVLSWVWVPFRRPVHWDGVERPRYPLFDLSSSSRDAARDAAEQSQRETWAELRKKSNGDWRLYRVPVLLPEGTQP